MTLRHRLTLWFTGLTGVLLIIFSIIIYFTAAQNREKEFYNLLKKEAVTKAQLIVNGKIDPLILQNIYRNNRQILPEVEVAVYDTTFRLMYHDAVDIDVVKETPEMLTNILQNGHINFTADDYQAVGFTYLANKKKFLVTAAAYDQYGLAKLRNLRNTLLVALSLALLIVYGTGKFFAGRALSPVAQIIAKAQKISAKSLHLRLDTGNQRDELAQLALTFNDMLDRLEKSFEAQKNFVFHMAHEVRTPLATLMAEAELTLSQTRTEAEYQQALSRILEDAQKLSHLVNNLLDLAKASYDPTRINFKYIPVHETLMEAAYELQRSRPGFRVEFPPPAEALIQDEPKVLANEYLLRVAFRNLMENGCKFSPDHICRLQLRVRKTPNDEKGPIGTSDNHSKVLEIVFQNNGPAIRAEEVPMIFEPFYRGTSQTQENIGHGIGLSLCRKIVELHGGKIEVESHPDSGNLFKISIPLVDSN
ncbi:MAG: ATP-binding protein [Flavobacteriales bacterium]|nr:ATP-binding protein [Flavobacteriales bacterium]MCX7767521.1 ATP-binding protein [Flavobacteriales bacterium]MDW8409656.1 ATP-binding protein [Flavobacteriales bacterium]